MRKICLAALFVIVCGTAPLAAQANPAEPNKPTTEKPATAKKSSKKNPIKNVDAIYEIRLGAYAKGLSDNAFDNLKDLGLLKVINNDNGLLLVYLGSYMGKSTANKVLATVKARGYKTAYLEKVKVDFVTAEGVELTHTYQFCSVKKLDVRRVGNVIAQDISMLDKLYISFDGSHYQMSLGLLSPELSPEVGTYKDFAAHSGFGDGFLRTFRPAHEGYVPPAPKPVVPIEEPKPTPGTTTKPTNDKADKISGNTTTNTADKADKISGNKTTNTADKSSKIKGGSN